MEIRLITEDDYEELHYNFKMRKEDFEELLALTGKNPYETMMESIYLCRKPTCITDDNKKIICVWGINDYLWFDSNTSKFVNSGLGVPWLITDEDFPKHAIYITRYAKRVFKDAFKEHVGLFNFVDSRYIKSIRFLDMLGFTIEHNSKLAFADPNVDFYMFHMLRPDLTYKNIDDYIKSQATNHEQKEAMKT